MKELIDSMKMTIKEFSETYEIPYNTVRQWYNEERQAPAWVKKLIEKLVQKTTQGEQINIEENKKYYLHYINNDLTYIYEDIEMARKWQSFSKNITKARITEIREITIKEEKTIMIAENLK